jgi:hypothetical protein
MKAPPPEPQKKVRLFMGLYELLYFDSKPKHKLDGVDFFAASRPICSNQLLLMQRDASRPERFDRACTFTPGRP